MSESNVLIIGEKESFLTRVLINKLKEGGITGKFVKWTVNDIHSNMVESGLITLYLDEGDRPPDDVMHFLNDKMGDMGVQLIAIGEKLDVGFILDNMSGDLVYKSYYRPLDNVQFVSDVQEYFEKVEAGEFKKNIMIVDDDPNYLGLVREWLKDRYKVHMANSGMQAIKMLGKNKVDLILLDHEMPVTSGPQVLEMLRADEETRYIPVMFLTGKSDKKSVMEVMDLKPEGYFLKSIERHELLQKLEDYFIRHK